MVAGFPSPTNPRSSRNEVLAEYLDYFRGRVIEKVLSLPAEELRRSRLSSGWTPLELLVHLRHVENRWLVWGFLGEVVADPWGDQRQGRWHVAEGASAAQLTAALAEQGRVSRRIITDHDLAQVGEPGERWDGSPPATLERVCLHLLQEYARHLGHLDIVAELAGVEAEE